MSPPIVLSIDSYAYMHGPLCEAGGFDRGQVERKIFPDGERYQRIVDDLWNRDVVLLGGTISDADTLELFDLACAAVKYGARTLTLVIPFFGYSTMERAVKPGEVVTAKTRARLLSAIPNAADGSRLLLVDLHAEGVAHYFEGDLTPFHVYAKHLVLNAIREIGGGEFVLGSTDAGRAKWVESLANDLGVPAGFILKRRIDGEHTEVVALSADVKGHAVVIYDDMIRTGSSLLRAAEAYREAGATRVSVVATHGVFPEGAVARMQQSGLVDQIVVSDSHPRALQHQSDFVHVKPLAPLLAEKVVRRR
ncbi:MAG: ribose-phosphate diphosphokinase [Polyangiaceae bacterium]